MPVRRLYTRKTIVTIILIAALLVGAYYAGQALARTPPPPVHAHGGHASPHPIPRPVGYIAAKRQCPASGTLVECRAALRRALAAVAWAKKERAHRWAPTVEYAIRLACASQPTLDCAWFRRMIGCESQGGPHKPGNPLARNRHSTAKGLAQFLDGTWSGNIYGRFSVFDPIANALGAAWLAVRNGRGPWYSSKGCWS